jgi:hypothetical protein
MKSLNPANDNNTILIVRRWQKNAIVIKNVNFFQVLRFNSSLDV